MPDDASVPAEHEAVRADPTAALLALLDLSGAEGAQTDEQIFVGSSARQPSGRVFGGQVLAQSLVAAMRTVDEGRDVHSMHAYFLRAGDATAPITFGTMLASDVGWSALWGSGTKRERATAGDPARAVR